MLLVEGMSVGGKNWLTLGHFVVLSYVIGQDGVIAYAEVNPDYTRRPEPTDVLAVLDQLYRSRVA
jgi:peroxiredoxin